MTQTYVLNEVITLRNELLSAKNLIDQSPEVKASRRLQGTIARCTQLLSRMTQKGETPDVAQKPCEQPTKETTKACSDG